MNARKMLLRQPVKTALGILLVALAVASLCLGLGQTIAAYETERHLNSLFQTVAFSGSAYSEETDTWFQTYAREHPDVIEGVSQAGLVSAYIPGLTPDNYTNHLVPAVSQTAAPLLQSGSGLRQFSTAALVVTLTEIGKAGDQQLYAMGGKLMKRVSGNIFRETSEAENTGLQVMLRGTVDAVVRLEQGFTSPVGYTAQIELTVRDAEALEELNLTVGQQYLVYTTTYYDDWAIRNQLSVELGIPLLPEFDLDKLTMFPRVQKLYGKDCVGKYDFGQAIHGVTASEIDAMHKVHLTVGNPGGIPDVTYTVDWDSEPAYYLSGELDSLEDSMGASFYCLVDTGVKTPVYPVTVQTVDTKTYTDGRGETVTIPAAEYEARYARPAIVSLTGSLEDFLREENGLWQAALEDIEINNHSFPMIGVEKLSNLPDFMRNMARIVEGRDFTAEELASGAPVCILSESLARDNGLQVGDTISAQLYEGDSTLPGQRSKNVDNPAAFLYHGKTTRLEEPGTYTIVGLYRQDSPWGGEDQNLCSFTPNTIFTPKNALPDWQKAECRGIFRTIFLKGSNATAFYTAVAAREYEDAFQYHDSGFEAVAESLESYKAIAGRVFAIGVILYSVLLVLFLAMYPMQQGKTLRVMERIGTEPRSRSAFVQLSSLGILVPGTALGGFTGSVLWNRVVQFLLNSAEGAFAVRLEAWVLVLLAVAHLAVAWGLVYLVSVPLCRNHGISRGR